MAISPDGTRLASGGDDSTVRIWRVADGRQLATLTGGSDHVYAVAYSPDGQRLAVSECAGQQYRLAEYAPGDQIEVTVAEDRQSLAFRVPSKTQTV